MASRRKRFAPKVLTSTDSNVYAAFLADLMSGAIVATKLAETTNNGRDRVTLDYDDPNG